MEYNTTDLVLFGAGGLQTVAFSEVVDQFPGLHLRRKDYFYAGNTTLDYYLFVMPNAPAMTVLITPDPIRHLCNPVLLCNGHGSCDPERTSEGCDCIKGLGYAYNGEFCTERTNEYDWLATVCSFTIIIGFLVAQGFLTVLSKKQHSKVQYQVSS
jgi:hypothetical protein